MRWLKGEVLPFLFKLTDLQSCDHNLFFVDFPFETRDEWGVGGKIIPLF